MPKLNKATRPEPEILESAEVLHRDAPASHPDEEAAKAVTALMQTADGTIGPWRLKKQIRQEPEYVQVVEVAKVVKSLLGKAEDQKRHFLEPFQEGVERIKRAFSGIIDPLKADEAHLKTLAVEYQEHKRQQEIDRAEKKAQALEEQGLDENAEDVRDLALRVEVAPKIDGVTFAETWSAKVVDEMAVIRAVVEGKLPLAVLKIQMPALNALARATKEEKTQYGVRFVVSKTARMKAG
jgi:hypothetical protein